MLENKFSSQKSPLYEAKNLPDVILRSKRPTNTQNLPRVVAIGASTGGVQVLEDILTLLIPPSPPVLIVQHIPPLFSKALAERLDGLCQVRVKEAEDGEEVLPSHVYIAPGDCHLMIKRRDLKLYVSLSNGAKVSRHRPSADVLFRSFANELGNRGIGIILTGMGDDGSIGLKEMYDVDARTIAQTKESCVVFGMPKAAADKGAVFAFLSPPQIANTINELKRW
jgi:two-component system chemotaxis response regulator CheB